MKFQKNVKNVRSFIKEQIEEKTFDFISSQLMPFCFIFIDIFIHVIFLFWFLIVDPVWKRCKSGGDISC